MADATKTVQVIIKGSAAHLKGALGGAGKAFGALKLIGIAAFVAISAAAIKFTADVIKTGAAFEQTMAQVGAISRATADQLQMISNKARAIGASTAFTAQQAGEGFILLARAGYDVEQQLGAIDATMLLAGATATDLGTATSAVVASLSQFNLSVEHAGRVADIFAAAASNSLFNVTGLAQAMKYGGTTGGAFGISIEKTTAALMQFRNIGLEAGMAGRSYAMTLQQLAVHSDKHTATLEQLGLTYADVNPATNDFGDILQTLADRGMTASQALDYFGARAGRGMAALIRKAREGTNEFENFASTMEESGSTAGEMYERMMDTVEGQWKILKSAIEEIKLLLFDVIGPGLKELLRGGAKGFQGLGNMIRKNVTLLRSIFENIVKVATAFKSTQGDIEVLEVVVKGLGYVFLTAIFAVINAVNNLRLAWWATKRAFITVIGLISFGFADLVDIALGAMGVISKIVGVFSKDAAEDMNAALDEVRHFSKGLKDSAIEDFDTTLKEGQEMYAGLAEAGEAQLQAYAALSSIQLKELEATNSALELQETLFGNIKGRIDTLAGALDELGDKATPEMRDAFAKIIESFDAIDEGTTPEEIRAITVEMDKLFASINAAGEAGVTESTEGLNESIVELGKSTKELTNLWTEKNMEIAEGMSIWQQALGDTDTLATNLLSSIESATSGFINSVVTGTQSFGKNIKNFFTSIGKTILQMLAKIAAKMAILGLIKVVSGLFTGGIGTIIGTATKAGSGFKFKQAGGIISGQGIGDVVPAMLTPGEFVVRAPVVRQPGMLELLQGLNRGDTAGGDRTAHYHITGQDVDYWKAQLRPGGAMYDANEQLGVKTVTD